MTNVDLCKDCQREKPAYIAGVMYKRCIDCLEAFDKKRAFNRNAKLARQAKRMNDLAFTDAVWMNREALLKRRL